jgi:hypothetical protein
MVPATEIARQEATMARSILQEEKSRSLVVALRFTLRSQPRTTVKTHQMQTRELREYCDGGAGKSAASTLMREFQA